jgi:hypothetical protein
MIPTAISAIHFYREHIITEEAKVTARLLAPPSLPERQRASPVDQAVELAMQILSAAAPNMTPAQIAEAQRMARQWRPK